jgi:hypothetical protein
MYHVALDPTARYGFSSLNDYKFVSQGILCSMTLLYVYHYIQYGMDNVVIFSYKFYYIFLSRFRDSLFAEHHLLIWEGTLFDSI